MLNNKYLLSFFCTHVTNPIKFVSFLIKAGTFLSSDMKKALFAGSFDPITVGHTEIIDRGLALFDEVLVGIGVNSRKKGMFEEEERKAMIEAVYKNEPRVKVEIYSELTVEFAEKKGIKVLLRGLRNGNDVEYEKPIALINKRMSPDLETVFLLSTGETSIMSSTLIREVIRFKGDLNGLVPAAAIPLIYK